MMKTWRLSIISTSCPWTSWIQWFYIHESESHKTPHFVINWK